MNCVSATSTSNIRAPPLMVAVYLRLRFNIHPIYWSFHRHPSIEYQLDAAFMRGKFPDGPTYEDAVGILVDGKVYVDDEPYWRNLLVEYETYDVVYLRRPLLERPFSTWAWDIFRWTPLIDAEKIPARSPQYTTKAARARLLKEGLIACQEQLAFINFCGYTYWNTRDEKEMREMKERGLFIDYERARLFNGSKDD